jgi:hypothetical protein
MRISTSALVLLLVGCESEAERQRKAAEAAATAERALFEKRKAEVLAAPERFLDTSNLVYYDKGIINDYRQLTGVTITNRAAVPIRVKKARVVWLTESGDEVGSSPLTLSATLAPGTDKRFSTDDGTMSSGTIQGSAKGARVEFTQIEVVESAQQ